MVVPSGTQEETGKNEKVVGVKGNNFFGIAVKVNSAKLLEIRVAETKVGIGTVKVDLEKDEVDTII